jgi:hypothetical protein
MNEVTRYQDCYCYCSPWGTCHELADSVHARQHDLRRGSLLLRKSRIRCCVPCWDCCYGRSDVAELQKLALVAGCGLCLIRDAK